MQYMTERPTRLAGGLLDVPRTVDDLFQRFWGDVHQPRTANSWRPHVDVVETPEAYLLRAEMPGVNPDDIEITLAGDVLTIRGEKVVENTLEGESWCLSERTGGRFERSFKLPGPLADDQVEAESRHGILAIRVLKAEQAKARRIKIRSA